MKSPRTEALTRYVNASGFNPEAFSHHYHRAEFLEDYLLEIGEHRILEMLAYGVSLLKLAQFLEVNALKLRAWLTAVPERSALFTQARELAGDAKIFEAEDYLLSAESRNEVDKAGKLAEHYRFMAGKLYRDVYGDKVNPLGNAPPFVFNVTITPPEAARREALEHEQRTGGLILQDRPAKTLAESLGELHRLTKP